MKVNNVGVNRQFLEIDDEDEVFDLLFNAYYKIVFNTIDKMLWDHSDPAVDAGDITQETFIKACEKREQIREPEKLLGWLLTIAKNLTRNEIRNAKRRRRVGYAQLESLDGLPASGREAHHATFLAETDTQGTEANRYLVKQLLCLLQGKDLEIVKLMFADQLKPEQVARKIGSTAGAVQKRWERLVKWVKPVMLNLEALVDNFPNRNDRHIMERYLDGQLLSEIAQAIGISRSDVEERVKRAIAKWRKAARQNPTDPVSAMISNKR